MRRIFLALLPLLLAVACSVPNRFLVTGVGYEPQENNSTMVYALPRTGLKVHIDYQKNVFIPGPYADFAQRQLGIEGVGKKRSEEWRIVGASLESTTEPDLTRIYSIAGIEGTPDQSVVDWAEQSGLILRGNYSINTAIGTYAGQKDPGGVMFKDVTMEPNEEMKEETIYKTLITDTSFVRVPVTTEQMERKTIERKAEEAARLILEIRSDRYYLAAGLVDPLPADFDMETAMESLDKLEEDYLSLFIGKSSTEHISREYFIVPEGSLETERYSLDLFSEGQGIGTAEAQPVELVIAPAGDARSLRNLMPQEPEAELYNHFYYRIPEICAVAVVYGQKELAKNRVSIYQSGALVREKVSE